MPVGDNKSNDDFARINQPLLAIDELWNRFTKKMGGRIIYNYHGPERRSFIRNPDGFERTVFLAGVNDAKDANGNAIGLIYVLGLFATFDSDRDRTFWSEEIASLPPDKVSPETLEPLLEKAWDRLKNVDLNFLRAHGQISVFPSGRENHPKDKMVDYPSQTPNHKYLN